MFVHELYCAWLAHRCPYHTADLDRESPEEREFVAVRVRSSHGGICPGVRKTFVQSESSKLCSKIENVLALCDATRNAINRLMKLLEL